MWEVVQDERGICLPEVGLHLDARIPVRRAFVSHAHFDHLGAHEEVICTAATARLMEARLEPAPRLVTHAYDTPWDLAPGVEARLYPAGHIMGSAQLHLTRADERLLYTGDFKLRPGRAAEPCATPPADVVIMETTFGRPAHCFPPRDDVMRQIARFCQEALEEPAVPVLFGYSLGKGQELLFGLAEAGLPVMLHPQVVKMTRIYGNLGVPLPPYREYAAEEAAGHVILCPPQAHGSAWLRKITPRRTAMITGWAMYPGAIYRYQCDAAFPLSDHAGFDDLLAFVERVGARRVFTVHGFAEDFARTLRARGVEAWALGRPNQLELMPESPAPARAAAPVPQNGEAASDAGPPPDPASLGALARTMEAIRSHSSKLQKIETLRLYLEPLAPREAGLAATYCTGRPFPLADSRVLATGWALLKRALLKVSGATEAEYRATYRRYSDVGETAAALLGDRTQPEPWALADTRAWFDELARRRSPTAKAEWLRDRLRRLTATEAKWLVKIITGDLRIGLKEGLVEEALAAAFHSPVALVREANMLTGNLIEVAEAAAAGKLETLEIRPFRPVQFMLASPEATAEAIVQRLGDRVWLEEKYDGIRCQMHKQAGRVEFYSRELKCITGQFPELVAGLQAWPHDAILDAELLAWQGGRALPFAELQKRLGRKGGPDLFLGEEIPVTLSAFDLLWHAGTSLLKQPLEHRRAVLEQLGGWDHHLVLAPRRWARNAEEIETAFVEARGHGNEGLMAKDPASLYLPGRRGLAWLKLKKAYATLDVAVVGAEWGHGKRKGLLSDVTFAVRDERTGAHLPIGKAYSGLTDAEIAQLTEHFLQNTLEERGHYRLVVPDTVLEVAFDTIQPSQRHASGLALRFPRILRIRDDKRPDEIDTLAHAQALARAASGQG